MEAAELARCSLLDTLAEAANSGADCLLAYAPARARACFESLAGPRVGLIEAEMPDLGQSLQRAQTAASIPLLESNLAASANALSTLIGEPPGRTVGLLQGAGLMPTPPAAPSTRPL